MRINVQFSAGDELLFSLPYLQHQTKKKVHNKFNDMYTTWCTHPTIYINIQLDK